MGILRSRSRVLVLVSAVIIAGVVAAVAVVLSPASADEPFGRDPRIAYRGDNVLQRWAAGHMIDFDQPITEAEAVAIAEAHNFVIAIRNDYTEHVPAMRAVNPDLKIYLTLNALYAQRWQGPGTNLGYPDEWYLRDANGDYVRASFTGNWMMNPVEPGWIEHVRDTCVEVRAESLYDVCYLDLLGPAPLIANYNTGLAIDPRTGEVWTEDDLYYAGLAIADAVRATNSDDIVIANSLINGNQYFREGDGSTRRLLAGIDDVPGVDVGQFETFLRNPSDSIDAFPDEARWLRDVNALRDVGTSGFVAITNTKTWTTATQEQHDQWHAYALASFLLATDGRQLFNFTEAKTLAASTVDHPWDRVDPGDPLDDFERRDGVYQRRFSDGVALVNPTDAAVTVTLSGPHRTLRGAIVSEIELAPDTGEVLVAEPAELSSSVRIDGADPSHPSIVVTSFEDRVEVAADPAASLYQLRYRPVGGRQTWFGPSADPEWTLAPLDAELTYEVFVRMLSGGTWGGWTAAAAALLPLVGGGGTTTTTLPPGGLVEGQAGGSDPTRPGLTVVRQPESMTATAGLVDGAASYQLKYQNLATSKTEWFPASMNRTWQIEPLDPAVSYRVWVRALIGATWQGWTSLTIGTVPTTTTTVPTTSTSTTSVPTTTPMSTSTTTVPTTSTSTTSVPTTTPMSTSTSTTTVPPTSTSTTTTTPMSTSTTTVPPTSTSTTSVPTTTSTSTSTTTVPTTSTSTTSTTAVPTTTTEVGIEQVIRSNSSTRPTVVATRYADRIEVQLEPVTGAASYQVKWQGTGVVRWFAPSGTGLFVIDGIDPGTDYKVWGRALIGGVWQGWTTGIVKAV